MTGAMSSRDMVSFLGQVDDNQNNEGIQDDENATTDKIDEVMQEIGQRHLACGGGYPFILRHEGTVLECAALDDRVQRIAYRYLLLCTRLRMDRSRVQAGLDGANLMERLSAHVLANYLGSARCQSLVFGTSAGGSFSDRVEKLCSALGEGGGLRPLAGVTPPASGDAKLDVVAWIPFRDRQPGQLVVFGQCKTGTNWRDTVGELQPDSFVKKWLRGPPLVDPYTGISHRRSARSRTLGCRCRHGRLLRSLPHRRPLHRDAAGFGTGCRQLDKRRLRQRGAVAQLTGARGSTAQSPLRMSCSSLSAAARAPFEYLCVRRRVASLGRSPTSPCSRRRAVSGGSCRAGSRAPRWVDAPPRWLDRAR